MKKTKPSKIFTNNHLAMVALILVLLFTASAALSHGGKHAGKAFTHLQALQKATGLYNRLVESGKLDASWETQLTRAAVVSRKRAGRDEVVVSFQRAKGDPQAVYIFFSAEGQYTGSNFTGD